MTKIRWGIKVRRLEHCLLAITSEKLLSSITQREARLLPVLTTQLLVRLAKVRSETCSNSSHSSRKSWSTEQLDTMMISKSSWKVLWKLSITCKKFQMRPSTKLSSVWPLPNSIKVQRFSQSTRLPEWCRSSKMAWSKSTLPWTMVSNLWSKDFTEALSSTIALSFRRTRLMWMPDVRCQLLCSISYGTRWRKSLKSVQFFRRKLIRLKLRLSTKIIL